jgi:hypothetical protein
MEWINNNDLPENERVIIQMHSGQYYCVTRESQDLVLFTRENWGEDEAGEFTEHVRACLNLEAVKRWAKIQ